MLQENSENTSINALDFQIDFTYAGKEKPALTNVKGQIKPNKCIVLCGSSGCGKSTLIRTINRLIPDFYEGELKGYSYVFANNLENLSIGQVGKNVSSVFQDPRSQFFTMNSCTEVAFGLENFGYSHNEMIEKVDKAFSEFGLERLKDKNVFKLSSGERQLVAIISAWALNTEIILLDEPTANLDFQAIEQLKDILAKLKADGKTIIISEHRLYYLKDLADEYWLMEDGKIKNKILADDFQNLSKEELENLALRTNDLNKIKLKENLEENKNNQSHNFHWENLEFGYKRNKKILDRLSYGGKTGEIIGLIGHNGSGKTTLGKVITGLYKAEKGEFYLDNKKLNSKQLRHNSIFIMQEAEFQFFTNSVLNELAYGCKDFKTRENEINELLVQLGLWECRNQHPFSLSGGQMQKLVLLLAYLSPKPIVVLDEPTAGLDYKSLEITVDLIRKMSREKIIFIITHDLELISKICTKCVEINAGKIRKEFPLNNQNDFIILRNFMGKRKTNEETQYNKASEENRLVNANKIDSRIKLVLLLVSLIVGIWTDLPLIVMTIIGLVLVAIYERHWGITLFSVITMTFIIWGYLSYPNTIWTFVGTFFPRIILIMVAAALVVQEKEAPGVLGAMRKFHIPENIIMISSVIFRFFPVLLGDLKIMNQSIKTRGFFEKFTDKLKSIPEYLEILIVPMVFRVIRIAESLAASAETRGIALKCKRESYITLKFKLADYITMIVFTALVITGLIL